MTWTEWGHERAQDQQLELLRDDLLGAASEARHLRSQLAQVQGSLEARVNRLAGAFDAFVELSDLRYELIGFAPAAELRLHAGRMLAALASGEQTPQSPPDVPGYWLGPAVAAVQELSAGTDAEASLAEAVGRDERRTAIFRCLALAALGRRGLILGDDLRTAFGAVAADGSVDTLQRALWVTAARGGFGQAGMEAIAELLRPAVPAQAEGKSWLDVLAPAKRPEPVRLIADAVVDQAVATEQLGRLRETVERIATDRAVREPASALGAGAALEAGTPAADPVVETLRLLIAEGSAPEHDLLARVAELRAKMSGSASETKSLDQPAGAVGELLAGDLRAEDEPHLVLFALGLVRPALLADAEALCERASAAAPKQVVMRVESQQVEIGLDGPDAASLAAAETKMRAAGQPNARLPVGAIAVVVLGVLGGIGLGFVHWFWIVVGLGVAAAGLVGVRRDRSWLAAERVALDDRVAAMRASAEASTREFTTYAAGQPGRARDAAADLDAIRAALPGQPAAATAPAVTAASD